ncbi:MAG: hypothetical protein DLM67_02810 [Candidatus Nephthysia bennettiae]|uniref:Uncharacterized protein n=1 Tax=Candidatus Nephthysia bennettiae TaxID=3127016 RepID=A0A934K998_9BACT|nr:hypothetical protein [Candidatus Dormibacteraeota bacterium]MBJ7614307.1 hypothetical protein [Candidatus Dormibacteraeota bacterium]PZR99842.1 MAG: hypothetical protein DLM67_02810 [Candidatus Dormibacteraeota bacterium]
MKSRDLLSAVADNLVPGVSIEDDGTLRANLAPFARIVGARRPGAEFGDWSREDREALVREVLADPDTALSGALQRVLTAAAGRHYGDAAEWPRLGYSPMQPGRAGPPRPRSSPELAC